MAKTPIIYYATGRRKTSTARVRLTPGTGKILINGHAYEEYFGLQTLQLIIKQPLNLTETLAKYDVMARVDGGGFPVKLVRCVMESPALYSGSMLNIVRRSKKQAF